MFGNKKSKQSAFTLIELLVVIAIIGILATLAVVYLQASRANARDAKRIADLDQLRTALSLYYHDYNSYPEVITDLSSSTLITKYMETIPTAPTLADGTCDTANNNYVYTVSADKTSYGITTCIGGNVNSLSKGPITASLDGIKSSPPPPWACGDNLIDTRDSQSYPTVQISTQCWMAKNLNIGTRVDGGVNHSDDSIIEKYCYDNLESNCNIYGGLYRWTEAMQYISTAGAQGICPIGWHIPQDSEWGSLQTYLGGSSVAGGKMKNTGTTYWLTPNTGASNSSGFSVLPAGMRGGNWGNFVNIGSRGYFYSSSGFSSSAWYRYLVYNIENLGNDAIEFTFGLSIRCLKN